MNDSRGQVTYNASSNRPPFYTDGVVDGTLLATTITKKVTVAVAVGDDGPPVADRVLIINSSGQAASFNLTVRADGNGKAEKSMTNPIYLASGEQIEVYARIVSIIEKNEGGGTQTGRGCRYLFTLEPRNR